MNTILGFIKRKGLAKRILSFALVLVMAVSLLQSFGGFMVAKAADVMYVTLHYNNGEYGWSSPALQFWGGDVEVSDSDETVYLSSWGVNVTKLAKESSDERGWYTITLKGNCDNFQLLDYDNPSNNTNGGIKSSAFAYCNKSTATDLYLKRDSSNGYKAEWFLDADCTVSADTLLPKEQTSFTKQTLKVHYLNTSYDQVAVYMKGGSSWSDIVGSYSYAASWPGAEVLADENNAGWYSFEISYDKILVNVIINNRDGKQLNTLTVDETKEINEFWLTGSDASDTTVSTEAPEGWVEGSYAEPVNPNAASTVKSPVVNADNTVTFNLDATSNYKDASEVYMRGNLPCTDWSTGCLLEKKDGVFTYTTPELAPGVYEYKFVVDGNWITDPANDKTLSGNSKVVIAGLSSASLDAQKGQTTSLPETLKLYDADGNTEDVTVSYAFADDYSGVSIDGNNLVIDRSCKESLLQITAMAKDVTSTITVNVKEKVNTYTIYYYDTVASHMELDAEGKAVNADCYAWEVGGASLGAVDFASEELADGNTWLKATIKSSASKLGVIPRSIGTWSWQTTDHSVSEENPVVYIVSGDAKDYTEIPAIVEPRERYVLVEYNRPENDYEGWNIYTWNSGFGSETEIHVTELNGKNVIIVPVKDSNLDFTLGFCMRRTTEDNAWAEKDGNDHSILVPGDQTIVYAVFDQDKGITSVKPYNYGYEMRGKDDEISFYYRNDELLYKNEEEALEDKVFVNINGTEYPMTYVASDARYEFVLENCKEGTYNYYYTVDGEKVLDAFNENTASVDGEEVSTFEYKKYDIAVEAKLLNASMNYRENNVLSLSFTGNDADRVDASEIRSMVADLSQLGLGTMDINSELMETSISVLSNVSAGEKTIAVTVTDIYGNEYATKANVVIEESKESDFDWDQAVIYMTCTDRFFDGNEDNNVCEEYPDDYDKDGSLSYHGGDFAGLEAKLDYLEDLGVNTIWITPIVENSNVVSDGASTSTGYHGYWTSDFTKLNSHLGTKEEFASLIDAIHARGMKLMVDVVLNHAGYDTEDYFNNILSGKAMLRDESNLVAGDDVYGSLAGLPDFVTEDSDVRNQLIEWQVDWMDQFDIDYYRVDTVKHVDSTTWAAFKNELTKVNPEFKMIGEYSGAGFANTNGELGTGTMDSLLDFDFNDKAKEFLNGNLQSVESFLVNRNNSINNSATLGAFMSSHDEDGLVQKLIDESDFSEEEALNLFKVAASLQLTTKGQAVIYYGEEIGLYGEDNYPIQSNRYDFDWDEAASQAKEENSMLNHYKKLLSIRADYKTLLARGSRNVIDANDEAGYDVFSRQYGEESLYVALNIKEDAQTITFKTVEKAGSKMKDLYSGATYKVDENQMVTVTVPAAVNGGTVILVKEKTIIDVIDDIIHPDKPSDETESTETESTETESTETESTEVVKDDDNNKKPAATIDEEVQGINTDKKTDEKTSNTDNKDVNTASQTSPAPASTTNTGDESNAIPYLALVFVGLCAIMMTRRMKSK